MGMLKVSAQSNAIRAAGALANTIRQAGEAEIQAIGPKAVNQTVKAIAIARSYLASSGIDLVAIPGFVDVEIEGEPRTALRFYVTPRHRLIEAAEAAQVQAQAQAQVQTEAEAPAGAAVESAAEPERPSSPPPEVLSGTVGPPGSPAAASSTPAPTSAPEAESEPFGGGRDAAASPPTPGTEGELPPTDTEEKEKEEGGL